MTVEKCYRTPKVTVRIVPTYRSFTSTDVKVLSPTRVKQKVFTQNLEIHNTY